ncbi:TOBE-like domain-containing protein, partial [Pseudomonas syringae]|uniref:TOBE-like domain-containing protein n=1 Tax=Pseudomonas syringae TaxID=317 RepID=UPI000209A055
GVIEQIGSPGEVYENPSNDFVYHFLGDSNRLSLGAEGHLLFRPHEVSLSRQEIEDHHAAEVRDIRPLGATTRVTLKVEGQDELIEAEVVKDHDSLVGLAKGETLFYKPRSGRSFKSSPRLSFPCSAWARLSGCSASYLECAVSARACDA